MQVCIIKVCVARCLAKPLGRNEDHGAQLGPAGRRASSGVKAGQAAVLSASAGAFFFWPH